MFIFALPFEFSIAAMSNGRWIPADSLRCQLRVSHREGRLGIHALRIEIGPDTRNIIERLIVIEVSDGRSIFNV